MKLRRSARISALSVGALAVLETMLVIMAVISMRSEGEMESAIFGFVRVLACRSIVVLNKLQCLSIYGRTIVP